MRSRSVLGAAALPAFAALAALAAIPTVGCLDRPLRGQDPRSTAEVVEPLKLTAVERIDLLFAIDNSASMADKQEILARAVPDLVRRLANPRCVDAAGKVVDGQPGSPTTPCPAGSEREFLAVPDIHVGIVSSSLGGIAKGRCNKPSDDDHGKLLSRTTTAGSSMPTYEGFGFLAWDPDQKLSPPGTAVLDDGATGLVPSLQEMVRGVGENGCGYEAQLESWYRFLIQPDPWKELTQVGDALVPSGTDKTLLDQRRHFLRPDSLVAIILLSDENDCSVAPSDDAARIFSTTPMIRPRSECKDDPSSECCAPCDQAPESCGVDATCKDANGNWARLDEATEDGRDLRCFDQKRRFGKSYLHPTERYVKGLTELHVPDRYGKLTSNPLFMDLDLNDDLTGSRNPGLVFFAGIVGVPWQDIAKDPTTLAKGLKSGKELMERDAQGHSGWDTILGDPQKGTLPRDAHMWESEAPRLEGESPVTGTKMAPPSAEAGADPISGHEQPFHKGNLQFACTFPLLSPIECAGDPQCDCVTPEGSPLCQSASGEYTTTQVAGKAFPGLRELEVLKGLQKQAIVASVCPANMDEATEEDAEDFGYRPAIGALIDLLKGKLGHQCLPRQLTPDENGQVGCLVIEARKSESCSCKAEDGRAAVTSDHAPAIKGALETGVIADDNSCFCEVPQLEGKDLSACQTTKADPLVVDGDPVDGWCYIDANAVPPVGSKELIPESCSSAEQRLIRFVGTAKARPGSELFIMCTEG